MLLKEYLTDNEIITSEIRQTYAPYLTTDGQDVINEILKVEYGNKEMFTSSTLDVENMTKMILLKNHLEYTKIKNILDNELNINLTGKTTRTPAETTQTRTPAETQTTTDLPEYTKTMTPAETTQTRTLPGQTTTDGGTEENVQTVKTKPFDSEEFIETEQTTDTNTPTTTQTVSYDNDEITKYETDTPTTETISYTKQQTVETMTLKDEVVKIESDNPEIIEEVKTGENIDNYFKYIDLYKINLYMKIIDDLLNVLCFSTWEGDWFDL